MIDLDLIRETTEVVTSYELSQTGVTLGVIALALIILWQIPVALVEEGLRPKTNHFSSSSHPNSVWAPVAALLFGGVSGMLGLVGPFTVVVISIAFIMTVSAFLYSHITRVEGRPKGKLEKWVTLGILVAVSLLLTGMHLVPKNGVPEELPTDSAMNASSDAMTTINEAILAEYDVELVKGNACFRGSSSFFAESDTPKGLHEDRIAFIEGSISGTADTAPGIRVLTDGGVVGCYNVLYDNETGEARLIVDAENTELPAPSRLTKG